MSATIREIRKTIESVNAQMDCVNREHTKECVALKSAIIKANGNVYKALAKARKHD